MGYYAVATLDATLNEPFSSFNQTSFRQAVVSFLARQFNTSDAEPQYLKPRTFKAANILFFFYPLSSSTTLIGRRAAEVTM